MNKIKVFISIALLLFLIGCTNVNYDAFAKCLADEGVTMYGAFWCPHCQNQKEMFGDSWKFVNSIECSTPDGRGQTEVCQQAGITGYPTWEFQDGSRVSGEITLMGLSQKSGCRLES